MRYASFQSGEAAANIKPIGAKRDGQSQHLEWRAIKTLLHKKQKAHLKHLNLNIPIPFFCLRRAWNQSRVNMVVFASILRNWGSWLLNVIFSIAQHRFVDRRR
jgi:hypothetical protein